MTTFDEQSSHGKLLCPMCNSRAVTKAPMAPALSTKVGQSKRVLRSDPPTAQPTPSTTKGQEELHKMRQFMTGLRKYVEQNAEYVGPEFPDEARKIHYGDSEERHIYGEASLEEAADLVEEGIDVAPLPPDLNETN